MSLRLHLLCKISLLIIVSCLLINCSNQNLSESTEQKVIVVKVPPFYDDKLSPEANYWRFRHFLFPQEEIPNPIPKGLPNDDSLLSVSIDKAGKINLNSENEGYISNTDILQKRLATIFQEREKNGVYETGNWKIIKAVGIKSDLSIKYDDFVKVVDAVKQSGAEPVVLLFDNDARTEFIEKITENKK